MARSLSQTLTRLHSLSTPISLRFSSTLPDVTMTKTPDEVERERASLKKLEDAIHRIIVKRSEPDWLKLVPGGSYWVPPKCETNGYADVIGKIIGNKSLNSNNKSVMKDRVASLSLSSSSSSSMSTSDSSTWPCSVHFFKGAYNSPMEGETNSEGEES